MIVAFLGIGMVSGLVASGYALALGGSFLAALAIYSGVGIAATLSAIALAMLISAFRFARSEWSDPAADGNQVSA